MIEALKREVDSRESDWTAIVSALGESFATRAAAYDAAGEFVAENYAGMRDARLFSAIVPGELGGGGASYRQVCAIVAAMATYCGSTALAYSMHAHPVALNVFKYRRGDEKARATLEKVAAGELVIATTGANDWLHSSGESRRVDGGFRASATKHFVSGAPGANVFVTSVAHDSEAGGEVVHFAVPMDSPGIRISDNWDTLGMRGTASHDVVLEDVFIPDAAVVLRRPAGRWHGVWDVILPTAMPLITSAYLGLARAAAACAVEAASHGGDSLSDPVGEMQNALVNAELVVEDMIRINDDHGFTPSVELSSAILSRKTLATAAVRETVERAAEIVGGRGFFRGHPLERIVRDVRAMHFHPLPQRRQVAFGGRVALGLDPVTGESPS